MLKQFALSVCYIIFGIALANKAFGQAFADSVNGKTSARENLIDNYYKAIGPQSRLYNGEEYEGSYPGVTGNAYFLDAADWGTGNIVYDGYTYKNIKLQFDINTGEVVIPVYNNYLKMRLISERISSFDLFGHHFIYLKKNPAILGSVSTGFYDELYDGKIQVLCSRSKSIQQEHSNATITSFFYPAINYYVFKNSQYFAVNGNSSFLAVFKDKKRDVQQYIKANDIKFKKDTREKDMARVAEYYDHLTQ